MERRNFLKAGVGGAMLTLTQAASGAQNEPAAGSTSPGSKNTETDLSVVVIGADGSVPSKPIVDKYIGAKADVWFYLPNLPEFSADLEFLDSDPRIKLAKSYADILANKKAGKLSMVIGWQEQRSARGSRRQRSGDSARPPRTQSSENITNWGCAPPILTITSPIHLAAECSIRGCP